MVTIQQRPGNLQNRGVFSHDSRGWQSEIKVPAGLVSSEASFPGLQMVTLLYLHMVFALCVHRESELWRLLLFECQYDQIRTPLL